MTDSTDSLDTFPDAAREVLDFWFRGETAPAGETRSADEPEGASPRGARDPGRTTEQRTRQQRPRQVWFKKDAGFDAICRERFAALVERAKAGALAGWETSAEGALALILLLDQFTRNIYRGTPGSFAGDAAALAVAQRLLERGGHRHLTPFERSFASMPFMHAESLPVQEQSVRLFEELERDQPDEASSAGYARAHRDIVARFGRFPHRNHILGRLSTPEEEDFLKQPGSSF